MQLLVAAAAVNIGADSSRVVRDEWGRELASGGWFCLCHRIQFVFSRVRSVARPCERNRVVLGLVPSFGVKFNLVYFFPLSLVRSVRGYLVVIDGRK